MIDPVVRFSALVVRPSSEVDLAEAALVLAAGAHRELDVAEWLGRLDRLARGIRDVEDLRTRLFVQLNLRGDADGYYDPENSFIQRVLERRRGIPISLGVVLLEVGRRAGVALQGVGMPGHFLVRTAGGAHLDPFDGGRPLDEAGVEELFRRTTGAGGEIAFGPHLLPVAGPHEILVRMLTNLRSLYRAQGAAAHLEWVLRMRLALPGAGAVDVAELGEALAAQGRLLEGARELEARAAEQGDHPDEAETLRVAARALRARLN